METGDTLLIASPYAPLFAFQNGEKLEFIDYNRAYKNIIFTSNILQSEVASNFAHTYRFGDVDTSLDRVILLTLGEALSPHTFTFEFFYTS